MDPSFLDQLDALSARQLFEGIEQASAQIGLGVFVVRLHAMPPVVLHASGLLAQLVGRPVDELVGAPCWELVAAEERDRVRHILASRGPTSSPIAGEFAVERPDGSRITVEVGMTRVAMPAAAQLAICSFRDVTEARTAARALQESEARLRALIEGAPDGIVIFQQHQIVLANPSAALLLGFLDSASAVGRSYPAYLPAAEVARAHERFVKVLQGIDVGPAEYRVLSEVERIIEVQSIRCDWQQAPAALTFVRDVTHRTQLRRHLIHADRLAAVGTMAAALAHEINNPMTYLQIALHRLDRDIATDRDPARADRLRGYLRDARDGAERVRTIVRMLPSFTGDEEVATTELDLVEIVERGIKLVEHALRYRARLIRNYAPGLPTVTGIAGRIEQLVINLLINAIHALPIDGLATNEIEIELRVREAVMLTVRDNRPPDHVPSPNRGLEPVTTPGFGLAVCKWILDDLGGSIAMSPVAAGRGGAEVTITLRASSPSTVTAPASSAVPAPAPASPDAVPRYRVLVIDDDALIRTAISIALSEHHVVAEAASGDLALALLEEQTFDVILCDVMMPGLDGRELYDRISARDLGIERRIVFVTGGVFVEQHRAFLERVTNLKLYKPFTLEQVTAVVVDAAGR
ncbi:MAG: PAS domain S-box protein [Deltaproteobacteria bacterium]|nr:PAS domain S-box protein [Deltaproteobacteria bacterium]